MFKKNGLEHTILQDGPSDIQMFAHHAEKLVDFCITIVSCNHRVLQALMALVFVA